MGWDLFPPFSSLRNWGKNPPSNVGPDRFTPTTPNSNPQSTTFCRPKEQRARTTSNPKIEEFLRLKSNQNKPSRVLSKNRAQVEVMLLPLAHLFNRNNPLIRLLLGFPVFNQHLRLIFIGINKRWWKWKEQGLFHQFFDWIFGYFLGWFDDSLVTCSNWLEIQNFNSLGKAFQKTHSQDFFPCFMLQLCATTPFSMQLC